MAYISKYSGEEIENAIVQCSQIEDIANINNSQTNQINNLNNKINNAEQIINNLNNTINTLQQTINTLSTEINNISTQIIPIERGGTGATTANDARANLNYQEGIIAYGVTAGSHSVSTSFSSPTFSSIDIINPTYAENSSSTIKVLKTGYYRITMHGRWGDVTSNNNCYLGYGINGNATDNGGSNGGAWWTNTQRLCHNVSFICKLSAGDYIKPVLYSNASTTMSPIYMSIEKISL